MTNNYAFFCDSNCELNYKTAKELGITNIIRMPYTICEKEYFYDMGETYDPKWFFNTVREGNIPITSALNPEDYRKYFEPFFERGEDILYVSFSSEMSGTFQYMDMAVKELQERFPKTRFVRYDTKAISMVAGIAVYAAAKEYNSGKSIDEVVAFLDELCPRLNASVVVDDLQHLKRGGRLSAASAFFGGLLKIKPIIKLVKAGKLVNTDKASGTNKAIMTIVQEVVAEVKDLDKYPIVIMNADCEAEAQRVESLLKKSLPQADIWHYNVGPVIGTHCGPGTLGICFVGSTRPEA